MGQYLSEFILEACLQFHDVTETFCPWMLDMSFSNCLLNIESQNSTCKLSNIIMSTCCANNLQTRAIYSSFQSIESLCPIMLWNGFAKQTKHKY